MKPSFFARFGVVLTSAFLMALTLVSFLPGGQASAHTLVTAIAAAPCAGETCNGLLPTDAGCRFDQLPAGATTIVKGPTNITGAAGAIVGVVALLHAGAPCNADYTLAVSTTTGAVAAGISRVPGPGAVVPGTTPSLFVNLGQLFPPANVAIATSKMVGDGTGVPGATFAFSSAGSVTINGANFDATIP
jgi:hypothetical protein